MSERQAGIVAKAIGGVVWQSGGGIWLAMLRRKDGGVIVFSGDAVCEYGCEEDFERAQSKKTILLN